MRTAIHSENWHGRADETADAGIQPDTLMVLAVKHLCCSHSKDECLENLPEGLQQPRRDYHIARPGGDSGLV